MQDGNANYAAATPVLQQLVVGKAAQSITFAPIPDKKYADGPFIPVANATSGLAVEFASSNPDVAIVSGGKIYLTGIGTTTITASQGGNENFTAAASVTQTLKVTKSSQTILFAGISQKTYGDPDFSPGAEASSHLGVTYSSSDNSIATIVNNKIHIVGVGTCNIYASQNGDDYYNAAITISQPLTVVKASQVINFDPLPAVTYGSADFEITASASSGLNVVFASSNSTVATVVNGVVHIVNAGSTYIIATQSGNEKYNEATAVSQLLVVNKQSQIIVLDTIYAKTYGCTDFVPEGLSSSGLPVSYAVDNPNVATMISGKVHVTGVGKTTIRARQAGNANYNLAEEVSRVLLVEKASLNVTPVSVSRNYLEANPAFTCKYDGFVNNEDASEIDIVPKVSTDADINSFPGIYDLTAFGGVDNNYKFNYQKGILLILGTMPLKASKPSGNSVLCVNSVDQEYVTEGAVFAYSYEWAINPTQAGTISSSGRTLKVNFNDNYTGRVAIAVKAVNNKGVGATSDSLIINVLPEPQLPTVKLRGTYCSSNSFGDSIKILDSQPLYQYQLYQNGEEYSESLTGTGGRIAWGNLMAGDYKITEEVCNVSLAEGLLIKKVDPSSIKPVLQVKWNDVIVCLDNGDSIESFSWYRNGIWLPEETKQYIWTQKEEGHYYVKTTDRDGCIFSSDSVWIDKIPSGQLYPNPNDGNFKITFTNSQTGKVTIRIINSNSSPVKVLSYSKSEELFETDISLPDIIPGTYFVDVLLNGERFF
ncbi:MAG TPA: MBG domain-containing protein, partial [Bacteroidales bacterium]|nr:MBG domain-containing protein [Bacteroidales bacterium]